MGEWGDWLLSREAIAVVSVPIYALLCWFFIYCRRQPSSSSDLAADSWLLAYASQGGQAQMLAERMLSEWQASGQAAQMVPLNQLDTKRLAGCGRAFFIVSTYGEGESPDNGTRFLSRLRGFDLSGLEYALLALGDRRYRFFCRFGLMVNQALAGAGARALFDPVTVDAMDDGDLRHWQQSLADATSLQAPDWVTPAYQNWTLAHRECLNPNSPGAPAFYLRLSAPAEQLNWQAGDIAEIGPRHPEARVDAWLSAGGHEGDTPVTLEAVSAPLREHLSRRQLPESPAQMAHLDATALLQALPLLPHREYSIASIPTSGKLDLLVRQWRMEDGSYGLGSGWLTQHAALGNPLEVRIRSNPNFAAPDPRYPLILIGNGTGMAGLRAHLQARAEIQAADNWLLFGERTRACDAFFAEEISRWQTQGVLQRVDWVFSRDAALGEPRYVQDLLRPAAEMLRQWVDRGAAIYVCGSLAGMAGATHHVLGELFGEQRLLALTEQGRYRRDVY